MDGTDEPAEFHLTAADKRGDYLRVLRAFDRARVNYQVLLHANDVAETWPAIPRS